MTIKCVFVAIIGTHAFVVAAFVVVAFLLFDLAPDDELFGFAVFFGLACFGFVGCFFFDTRLLAGDLAAAGAFVAFGVVGFFSVGGVEGFELAAGFVFGLAWRTLAGFFDGEADFGFFAAGDLAFDGDFAACFFVDGERFLFGVDVVVFVPEAANDDDDVVVAAAAADFFGFFAAFADFGFFAAAFGLPLAADFFFSVPNLNDPAAPMPFACFSVPLCSPAFNAYLR